MRADGPVWVVVVAGGSGTRYGGAKQLEVLAGVRVLDRSLAVARAHADGVVLVTTADRASVAEPLADQVVVGGASRADSVRAGLAAVPADAAVVVVHDAARPLASAALFASVIDAVRGGADAAITAIPVVDTIKRVQADRVVDTVAREELVAVQTPQAFRADVLRRAHADGGDATDDAALVERMGGSVVVVPGDPRNRKLTTPEDLLVLEAFAADAARDGSGT